MSIKRFPIYEDYNDLQSPRTIEEIEGEVLDMFSFNKSSTTYTAYLVRDKQQRLLCIIYYCLNEDSYFFVDHINSCVVAEVTMEQWEKFKKTGKLDTAGVHFG